MPIHRGTKMGDLIEFLLDVVSDSGRYWRFWCSIAVAAVATWAFASYVSNTTLAVTAGIVFMLIGAVCGYLLHEKYGPD